MSTKVAIMNPKGGVGKTTASINLAGGLVERGKRVLLVDLDDQFYASRWAGLESSDNIVEAMLQKEPLKPVATSLGFDMVPASKGLSEVEADIAKVTKLRTQAYHLLGMALRKVEDRYDMVVLDCPGDTDFVTLNGLLASDAVVIASKTAHLSLTSLGDTWDEVLDLFESSNKEGRVRILLGMHQRSKKLHQEVVALVREEWEPSEVFETVIPLNVRLEECSSHRATIFQHDAGGVGTQAFRDLTEEVISWLD